MTFPIFSDLKLFEKINTIFFCKLFTQMNNEQHQRIMNFSIVEPDQEDHFDDRRLSDLLPTELIRQNGLDPEAFLFNNSLLTRRRMTDPGIFAAAFNPPSEPPNQRRMTTTEKYPPPSMNYIPSPLTEIIPQKITNWFLVELADRQVRAFTTIPSEQIRSDGVVVLDKSYLRFGRILQEIKGPASLDNDSHRIINFVDNPALSDYVMGQKDVASALIPTFLKKCNVPSRFISLEPVSFDCRTLFRIKLTRVNVPNIDAFIRLLIQAFCVAVEVYE